MDEAAERRIEERLAAHFGNKIPPGASDARGLQTSGTFFRDGTAEDARPERPPSPYTSLFLTPIVSGTGNGQMEKSDVVDRTDDDMETKEHANVSHVGQKRPRSDGVKTEDDERENDSEKGDGAGAEKSGDEPGSEGESDGESGESDDGGEEEESSEEGSSSPSDAEDELTRATSFRDQVADNERYRKRIRDAHAHAPTG